MKIITGIILFILIIFFSWHYLFSIYEIKFKLNKNYLKPGEPLVIEIVPLNSFGKKIPLRHVSFYVDIIKNSKKIYSKYCVNTVQIKLEEKGEYELRMKSEFDLFPSVNHFIVE